MDLLDFGSNLKFLELERTQFQVPKTARKSSSCSELPPLKPKAFYDKLVFPELPLSISIIFDMQIELRRKKRDIKKALHNRKKRIHGPNTMTLCHWFHRKTNKICKYYPFYCYFLSYSKTGTLYPSPDE